MHTYHEEFTRLKAGVETRKIARSLYLNASELTKPGSGRTLGHGQSALSAVCAFLASKRLGNGEVTRDQACAVACVDPKTFDSTVTTVESVLPLPRSSPRLNQTNITYRSLLKQFVAREDAVVPMAEVEESLKGCELWVDGSPIDLESPIMQGAIFYWVLHFVLRVSFPDATHLRQILKVSQKTWSAYQRVLENHCSHMLEDLIRKAETALSSRAACSQTQTVTREKVQALTNRLAYPGKPCIILTPPKTPLLHKMKRKMLEVESNRATQPPRDQLDCSAWDHQKPTTTTTEGSELLTPSSSIQDSLPVGRVALDNTPMTSTGMSDTSSPSSNSRTVVRARRHVSLAAKRPFYPIQEEEMPRRRRRNLRADFLNSGVYGWKPAAHTAKKLARARNWESLMVRKYGDPWEAW